MTTMQKTRKLYIIADEIRADWKHPYFGAVPYIQALGCLARMDDMFGAEDGDDIVRYFLANATTWRGDTARRVKAELREMLAQHRIR